MNWILLVVVLTGYGSRPDMRTVEFYTKERCEAALVEVRRAWDASRDSGLLNKTVCLQK